MKAQVVTKTRRTPRESASLGNVFPATCWVFREGRVIAAPKGHFWAALEIMRLNGKALTDVAASLEADFEDTDDDAVHFSISQQAYEEAEKLGYYRCIRHEQIGVAIDSDNVCRWEDIPRVVRTVLEDASFRYELPVILNDREVRPAPCQKAAVEMPPLPEMPAKKTKHSKTA